MNARRVVGAASLAVLVAAALAAGCQRYEFEPVVPKAFAPITKPIKIEGAKLAPNVMLVVDKSGSMADPVPGGAKCPVAANGTWDRNIHCRWNELLDTFATPTGFVAGNQGIAQFGLALFPRDNSCAAGVVDVAVGASADVINSKLNSTAPLGGTPTANTLRAIQADPKMATAEPGRDRIVMLLTDGAPNCNSANASLCNATCATATAAPWPAACAECRPLFQCDVQGVGMGCLDERGTVAAVSELAAKGIRTFVIGFGIGGTTDPAHEVLNQAAVAGGLAKEDPTTKYYPASDAAGLKEALAKLTEIIVQCSYLLSPAPSDDRLVQVVFVRGADRSETVLARDTDWTYTGGSVKLSDARCAEVNAAKAADQLQIEFRYVSGL